MCRRGLPDSSCDMLSRCAMFILVTFLLLPSVQPLVPSVGIESLPAQMMGAFDAVRVAYLPNNLDTAIAVGVAEAFAGALGGLASRGTANAIDDKKKDSLQTKVQTTSAFFGTRGLLRATGRVLGVPRPLTIVAASVLGSIASEATKKAGRASDQLKRRGNQQTEEQSGEPPLELLSATEITGDVMKWLSYDILFQATAAKTTYPWEVPLSFLSGGGAAVIGLLVFDLLEKARLRRVLAESDANQQQAQVVSSSSSATVLPWLRGMSSFEAYEAAALEGAILFGVFQIVYDFLNEYLPEGARFEFPFYRALGAMEGDLLSGLQSTIYLAQHLPLLPLELHF